MDTITSETIHQITTGDTYFAIQKISEADKRCIGIEFNTGGSVTLIKFYSYVDLIHFFGSFNNFRHVAEDFLNHTNEVNEYEQ